MITLDPVSISMIASVRTIHVRSHSCKIVTLRTTVTPIKTLTNAFRLGVQYASPPLVIRCMWNGFYFGHRVVFVGCKEVIHHLPDDTHHV